MLWHQSASPDLAHSWLRGVVRELFQREDAHGKL